MSTILSRRVIALALSTSCLLLVGSASATVINLEINFGTAFQYTGVGAAPDPGTFWNPAPNGVPTPSTLKASDGTTNTAATFSMSGQGGVTFYAVPPAVAKNLFTDYAFSNAISTDPSLPMFTIGGLINGGYYDLYLYSMNSGAQNGDITTFTVDSINKTATNSAAGSTTTFVQNGNYVEYASLIATGGTISGNFFEGIGSTTSASFNGFQLVQVPEPSSIVLSSLGLAGLVAVSCQRRRKALRNKSAVVNPSAAR